MEKSLRLYFPFVDGAIGYNCNECGYRCCSIGAGMFPTKAELDWLTPKYPSLPLFVARDPSAPDSLACVLNHTPRCHFLRGSGECDIHATHGRERKPLMCRLFPAVRFMRVGDTLVVDFHAMCPIRLWAPGSGDYRVSYADLRQDIEASLSSVLSVAVAPALDSTGTPRLDEAALDREEWLRDLPSRDPDLPLIDHLAIGDGEACELPGAGELDRKRRALRRSWSSMRALLSADVEHSRNERLLIALLPRIRLRLAKEVSPRFSRAEVRELSPRIVLALATYLEIAASLNGASVTVASIDDILTYNLPLFTVLALAERVARLQPSPELDELDEPIRRVVRALQEQRGTLGEIIRASFPAHRERALALRHLGGLLPALELSSPQEATAQA